MLFKFDGEVMVLWVNRSFVMDFSGSRASAWGKPVLAQSSYKQQVNEMVRREI